MRKSRTLWVAFLGFAGATLACIGVGGPSTLPTGEPAPIFGVKVGGKTVTLEDLQGDVVVVNFWSSS